MKPSTWWHWLVLLFVGVAIVFFPIPARASTPVERVIKIDASRFEYNPSVLHVNPGDRVTIELTATDVVHGLAIDGYNLQTTADPGQTATLSFTADKVGSFRYHCTVTCGNMHPFMAGKLEVGNNTLLLRSFALLGLSLIAVVWKGSR
jgi:heme/copper-type cytochrome/quinol oxidase subunit 2